MRSEEHSDHLGSTEDSESLGWEGMGEVAELMKGLTESKVFFSWASHIVPRLNSRSCTQSH